MKKQTLRFPLILAVVFTGVIFYSCQSIKKEEDLSQRITSFEKLNEYFSDPFSQFRSASMWNWNGNITREGIIRLMKQLWMGCGRTSSIEISAIQCNGKTEPVGVETEGLSFSWQMSSDRRNQWQRARQVVVGTSKEAVLKGNYLWNSGKRNSKQNLHIPYEGPDLESATRYYWRVKVWDRQDNPSQWSGTGSFVTGLFHRGDWAEAQWIGYETLPDSMKIVPGVHGKGDNLGSRGKKRPVVPLFRREFKIDKPIEEASLFISGLGHYEASLNGEKVGNRFLSPGWTYYQKTILNIKKINLK